MTRITIIAAALTATLASQAAADGCHKCWIHILSATSGPTQPAPTDGAVDASDFNIWQRN